MRVFEMHQVVVVRRDFVSLIQTAVQAGHAIGKATYRYAVLMAMASLGEEDGLWLPHRTRAEWKMYAAASGQKPRVEVSTDDGHPSRIWKGVQNQKKLEEVCARLDAAKILYELVVEPDDTEGGLKGQPTALCTLPYPKDVVLPHLSSSDTFDLRLENCAAFKDAALAMVVKQLQSQMKR